MVESPPYGGVSSPCGRLCCVREGETYLTRACFSKLLPKET